MRACSHLALAGAVETHQLNVLILFGLEKIPDPSSQLRRYQRGFVEASGTSPVVWLTRWSPSRQTGATSAAA
jgi:hypothetical protein